MFFRRLSCFTLLSIPVVIGSGCQKKAPGPPPRYAIVRFENLTGDPALDWAGREASEVLAVSLAGGMDGPVLNPSALRRIAPALGSRPAVTPGISGERDQAMLAGANRIVSGYLERTGNALRIAAVEEDLTTGRNIRTFSVQSNSGPVDLLLLLKQLAREFTPTARPYFTSNSTASERFFKGIEAPLDASRGELNEAVELDPDFGPPWLSLVRLARLQGNRTGAGEWIAQARTHKLDPLSMAELDSETAAMGAPGPATDAAKLAALRKISELSPGDTNLLRTLAQSETAAGQFAASAADWKKLADTTPGDGGTWNSLGYARSWAGDYAGAVAALDEYKRLRPNEANPLDSLGDIYYVNRKFKEAADSYLQADARERGFQRYGELYKAAWAKFQAGDKKGADELFGKFRAAREKISDPLLALLIADWSYRTGRPKEAVEGLRNAVKEMQSAPLRAEGYSLLAVWDLIEGDRARAREDSIAAGIPTTPVTAMTRFAAGPSAPVSEWEARVARSMTSPALTQFSRVALGYALLLDGKREAALPVWEEIVKSTPATDFFSRAIYARLRKQPVEKPLLPEPNQVNQFAVLLDKL